MLITRTHRNKPSGADGPSLGCKGGPRPPTSRTNAEASAAPGDLAEPIAPTPPTGGTRRPASEPGTDGRRAPPCSLWGDAETQPRAVSRRVCLRSLGLFCKHKGGGGGAEMYDVQHPSQLCHSFSSCLCPRLLFHPEREFEIKPTPSCKRAEVRNKIGEGSWWPERRLSDRRKGNCPRGPASPPGQPGTCLPETPAQGPERSPRRHLAVGVPGSLPGSQGALDHRVPHRRECTFSSGTGTTIEIEFHAFKGAPGNAVGFPAADQAR